MVLFVVQNFKNLNVYQEAYRLSRDIYGELKDIDKHWRLKDQLFGSTTSVCTNLAEMAAFENKNQQRQKILTCIGECNETEFWLTFCKDSGLLEDKRYDEFNERLKKVRKMLFNLKSAIETDYSRRQ